MIHAGALRQTKKQHTAPCHDCPWRRAALPGWLGANTAEEWLEFAHNVTVIPCHTKDKQCAGAAIFRTNVLKTPRTNAIMMLPKNKITVFSTNEEFRQHHSKGFLK